jgi:hypothetical protein
MINLIILMSFLLSFPILAENVCSRVATVNFQQILVDVSSKNRGEGLRYYLEKDEVAKSLLNEYQDNNRPTWRSAALSTMGSAMILGGMLRTNSGDSEGITSQKSLLFGGISLIAMSYLISKTNQYNNEYLLLKSVEEYNKRNTPKIYFSPTDPRQGLGLGLSFGQEF